METVLSRDAEAMRKAGVQITRGDLRCLAAGHAARMVVNRLRLSWDADSALPRRMAGAGECLAGLIQELQIEGVVWNSRTRSAGVRRPAFSASMRTAR